MEYDEEDDMITEEEMEVLREMEKERDSKFKKSLFNCDEDEATEGFKRKDNSLISLPDDDEEKDIQIEALNPPQKKRKIEIFRDLSPEKNHSYQSISVSTKNRPRQHYYVKLRENSDDCVLAQGSSFINDRPFDQLLEEAVAIKSMKNPLLCDDLLESTRSSSLWVETYKPKTFMHLLSDDAINRGLLQWLKLWDKVVFDRTRALPKIESTDPLDVLDDSNRPTFKVVLLHGPPGLGKTTLAHVLAKQAGYNSIEINSSDDRSLAVFKNRIEPAIQMKSVISSDKKPNCVIVDEIDGCPAATIKYLVELIKDKRKSVGILRRPIICICNDLYTPSLRPLRQLAKTILFPPTSSIRLAERLQYISNREKIRADLSTLTALCEKTNNDIRACLSTLQFFKTQGIQRLQIKDVRNANVGLKDMQKSNFTVWDKIFELPRSNKTMQSEDNSVDEGSILSRYNSVWKAVSGSGDYDRLMKGVFENYLNVKFRDTRFENIVCANDWILTFDILQRSVNQTQIYTLMSYFAFPFVSCHFRFAASSKSKIVFPHSEQDYVQKLAKSNYLVSSCLSEMSPYCRSFVSQGVLIRDVLPCLLEIMHPNLRALNTQLYSSREKKVFKDLISTMVSYNITYSQYKLENGQYAFKLDPCIDDVAHFPGIKHSYLSYAVQQIVSHEISIEKMRQSDVPIPVVEEKPAPEKQRPILEDATPVDFFGRKISQEKLEAKINENVNDFVKSDIWFKFKEGYNNAVRRTVRVSDFL